MVQKLSVMKQLKRNQLTIQDGCIMWGTTVTVPFSLGDNILKDLHEIHMGLIQIKAISREGDWWPNIDRHIN